MLTNNPSKWLNALAIAIFLSCTLVFIAIAHEVVIEHEDWFDSRVFVFLKSHSKPGTIQAFKFISFFGSSPFLLPSWITITSILLIKRQTNKAIKIASLALSSTFTMYGMKAAFARPRPDLPLFEPLKNFSFPSGHALSSMVICSAIVWLIWSTSLHAKWKWCISILLYLFAISIGISRIVLRYHYASDVVGGFSLGIAFVLLFFWLASKLERKH